MYSLDQLDIVGYANVLTPETVPSIVAPVFKVRDDNNVYLFPPFTIQENQLCDPVKSSPDDFERLVAANEVTPLSEAVPARSGYELWIDEDMNPHYERAVQVDQNLADLADKYTEEAKRCFNNNDLDNADLYSNRAISANGNLIAAWAIKAAVRYVQGKDDSVELLADMVEQICPREDFKSLVLSYLPKSEVRCSSNRNQMKGIAAERDSNILEKFPEKEAA